MTDEFITHNSTEPPELAPAVLVEIEDWNMSFMAGGVKMHPLDEGVKRHPSIRKLRVDQVTQWFMLKYRVLRNPDGHPYVSADGLEGSTQYVFTDPFGTPYQSYYKPHSPLYEDGWEILGGAWNYAPSGYAHPGDWRDSLHAVWREDHE